MRLEVQTLQILFKLITINTIDIIYYILFCIIIILYYIILYIYYIIFNNNNHTQLKVFHYQQDILQLSALYLTCF